MAMKMTDPKKGTKGSTTATANKSKVEANKMKVAANAKKVADNKAKVEANRAKVNASKKPAPAPGKGVTKLPMVTVTAKRTSGASKPATSAATPSKKPLYTGNPNVTYLTKDKNNKNVEVTYDQYRKIKGSKTTIPNDASGYPVVQGSGGSRYREYTPLPGKKYTGSDMFKPRVKYNK